MPLASPPGADDARHPPRRLRRPAVAYLAHAHRRQEGCSGRRRDRRITLSRSACRGSVSRSWETLPSVNTLAESLPITLSGQPAPPMRGRHVYRGGRDVGFNSVDVEARSCAGYEAESGGSVISHLRTRDAGIAGEDDDESPYIPRSRQHAAPLAVRPRAFIATRARLPTTVARVRV
ncbi:hypothetical protein C8R45DRAFT_422089 [Mycena sanguinolenta]|nr:hypothetical protein C8R45DRAFT_422089 [Mycena sanguinolenta]